MPPFAGPIEPALRPAEDADRAFCYGVLRDTLGASWTAHHGQSPEEGYLRQFELEWADDIRPSTRMIDAGITGETIGMLTVYEQGWRVFVRFLALAPAWQSRGVGAAVLRGVIADASPRPVELKVTPTNTDARRFYERLNFQLAESHPDYLLMRFGEPMPSPTCDH